MPTGSAVPPRRARKGPRIDVGFQAFDENEMLAHLYAAALRGAGFRVRVRAIGGLRPETIAAFRRKRIDAWIGYSGSLLGYLRGTSLRRSLARIGATPQRLSPAENRNSFAMKRDVAERLGITKLSDLARYWPGETAATARAAAVAPDARQGEQWAVAEGSVLHLPGGVGAVPGHRGDRRGPRHRGADRPSRPGAEHLGELRRSAVATASTTTTTATSTTSMASTCPAPSPTRTSRDGHGHGTHVAGIIAAALNGNGVVGVGAAGEADDRQGARQRRLRQHRLRRRGDSLRGRQRRADHQPVAVQHVQRPARRRGGSGRRRPRTCWSWPPAGNDARSTSTSSPSFPAVAAGERICWPSRPPTRRTGSA